MMKELITIINVIILIILVYSSTILVYADGNDFDLDSILNDTMDSGNNANFGNKPKGRPRLAGAVPTPFTLAAGSGGAGGGTSRLRPTSFSTKKNIPSPDPPPAATVDSRSKLRPVSSPIKRDPPSISKPSTGFKVNVNPIFTTKKRVPSSGSAAANFRVKLPLAPAAKKESPTATTTTTGFGVKFHPTPITKGTHQQPKAQGAIRLGKSKPNVHPPPAPPPATQAARMINIPSSPNKMGSTVSTTIFHQIETPPLSLIDQDQSSQPSQVEGDLSSPSDLSFVERGMIKNVENLVLNQKEGEEDPKKKGSSASRFGRGILRFSRQVLGTTLSMAHSISEHSSNFVISKTLCYTEIASRNAMWLFAKKIQNAPNLGNILERLHACKKRAFFIQLLQDMVIGKDAMPGVIASLIKINAISGMKLLEKNSSILSDKDWLMISSKIEKENLDPSTKAQIERLYAMRFAPWKLSLKNQKITNK